MASGLATIVSHAAVALALACATLWIGLSPARAVDAVNVRTDAPAIDLTLAAERPKTDGDRVQVSTAPGPDGIVRRIEVRGREAGNSWAVFALANTGDEQLDRLIVVPHYRMVGSGLFWPDLGLSRVVTVTPSAGERPERQDSATADVFRITLDPGSVVTYVLELRSDKLPQLYLWEPDAYKDKINSFTLYYGIVIGISGLARAVSDHPVRGEGLGDVPRGRSARLGGAGLYRHRFRILGQGVRHVGGRRAHLARDRRMRAGRDPAGVPVRLSQSQPLACALRPYHHRLARRPCRADRGRALRSGGRIRHRALLAPWRRVPRSCRGGAAVDAGLRPRRAVDPDLVPALHLDDRRGPHHRRPRHQRHRRTRAARRSGADRDADRVHRDAACLCRFDHARHRHRRGAARAGADRRRRHDLGLGRVLGQGLYQPRNRGDARAQARCARRLGRQMARRPASARPRSLPRHPRQRDRTASWPADGRFPAAHAGRPLSLVHAEGASGGRLRRRSGAAGRHADRRHRIQDRRRAAAARRRARQPHRAAEPSAVPRSLRGRAGFRQDRSGDATDRDRDRPRPFQAGQRFRRHGGRRFHPADAGAPPRPPAEAAGHAGPSLRRSVRADSAVGARSGPHHRLCRKYPSRPSARRSPSTTAKSS